jgi:outer membrane protein assembly factor BamB
VAADGTVYFGSRDRKLYAVTPEGKKKWAFKTGAWVDSSPALGADGTVYFGSWDHSFYALGAGGASAWKFETGGPIVSSPAIGLDGKIYFGSHDGKFYALAPDGAKAWDAATGAPVISSPALDKDGTVYFSSVSGYFYALNAGGSLKWRVQTGGITESSPVIGPNGTVYIGVNKKLWAFSPNGKKEWEREATSDDYQQPIEATPTALSDGTVLLVSNYGLLMAVEAAGSPKWMYYLFGHGPASPAVGPDGTVYISGQKGELGTACLALPARVPLAHSPWPKFRGDPQNTGRQRAGPD